MTNQEITELKKQLEEKKAELKAIYDKLTKAGVTVELPDDILEEVAGGTGWFPGGSPSRVPMF